MLPLKWRLYKILNYILLAIGLLLTAYIFYILFIRRPDQVEIQAAVLLINILFFMMAVHSIINIVMITKLFPNKSLSGSNRSWNTISIIANILSSIGLTITLIGGAIAEFEESSSDVIERDPTGKFILLIVLIILLSDLFVLICQFKLSSYLRNNSIDSISSMIDSIGKE